MACECLVAAAGKACRRTFPMTHAHSCFLTPLLVVALTAAVVIARADDTTGHGRRPRVLVTNDDGIEAPGLHAIVLELESFADLLVAAPEQNASGSSQSFNLRKITVRRVGREEVLGDESRRDGVNTTFYAIDATPATCVHLAVTHLAKQQRFDLVVSGINHGQNVGVDTRISGTVGAAKMAFDLGLRSTALSLDVRSEEFRGTAARAATLIKELLGASRVQSSRVPLLLNVNFPQGPPTTWKAPLLARLGGSAYEVGYHVQENSDGTMILEPTVSLSTRSEVENTDRWALERGHITLTPLAPDRRDEDGEAQVKKLKFLTSK